MKIIRTCVLSMVGWLLWLPGAMDAAERYENLIPPERPIKRDMAKAWERALVENQNNLPKLLDDLLSSIEPLANRGLENASDELWDQGFVVKREAQKNNIQKATIIVTPRAVIYGQPFVLEIILMQGLTDKTPSIEIAATMHLKRPIREWKKEIYPAGSILSEVRKFMLSQVDVKEFSDIDSVTMTLEQRGALRSDRLLWVYAVSVVRVDRKHLPVASKTKEFFGVSGLRSGKDDDGKDLQPTGQILRKDDVLFPKEPCARDKNGAPIWDDF